MATKTDIWVLDLISGKVKWIVASLVNSTQEIGDIWLYFDQKHFICANSDGELKLHSILDGTVWKELVGHRSEVTDIILDHDSRIVVSCGWDSVINIQWDHQFDTKLRARPNAFGLVKWGKEIYTSTLSWEKNMLATASWDYIFLWSYD